jgi:hypothetical protein
MSAMFRGVFGEDALASTLTHAGAVFFCEIEEDVGDFLRVTREQYLFAGG